MSASDNTSITLKGEGLDSIVNLIFDGYIRPIIIDDTEYASLVDLMSVFGQESRKSKSRTKSFNARRYWNDKKKALLSKDRELSDSIGQLKLRAEDGKMRQTDIAPLWACVFIVLLMDTPIATEFKKRIAKFSVAEIKHRMGNVARSIEWAADTVHKEMIDGGCQMTFKPGEQEHWWQE